MGAIAVHDTGTAPDNAARWRRNAQLKFHDAMAR
jgi:hypothetical protein